MVALAKFGLLGRGAVVRLLAPAKNAQKDILLESAPCNDPLAEIASIPGSGEYARRLHGKDVDVLIDGLTKKLGQQDVLVRLCLVVYQHMVNAL